MKRILSMLFVSLLFASASLAIADTSGSSGENLSSQVDSAHDDSNISDVQTSVPEPATLTLLIIGGIGVLARHRRRRSR